VTYEVLLDGLAFPEGPRWHDGRLWFSDMYDHWVFTVDLRGRAERIVEIPNQPSGLGWLPDGRMLVVSMLDRRLLRLERDGHLAEVANLSAIVTSQCNDMVVDGQGRAYVGNFGYDFAAGEPVSPTDLVMVDASGSLRVVARGLTFPNGTVITPDRRTLIIAETFASRLTAFDVEPDGGLARRRAFAQMEGTTPDGICLDAEGAIWFASPGGNEVVRVREGGTIVDRISTDGLSAFACMLGGEDRQTLFVCVSDWTGQKTRRTRPGRILTVRVKTPGAGLP